MRTKENDKKMQLMRQGTLHAALFRQLASCHSDGPLP